jgi:hypothetical protein
MKKQIRGLIISLIALVLLVAVVLVSTMPCPESRRDGTPGVENVALLSQKQEDIQSIAVQTSAGSWTASMSNGSLTFPSLQGYPLDGTRINSLLTSATNLEAIREIRGSDLKLADYGLEQPSAQVTITNTGGKQYQFSVGNAAPASLGTFVLMNSKVYLVATDDVSIFQQSDFNFVSSAITQPLAYGDELQAIKIDQNGEDISLTYVAPQPTPTAAAVTVTPGVSTPTAEAETTEEEVDLGHYVLNNPGNATVSYADVSAWAGSGNLIDLSASSVVELGPDATQLSNYGFDKPTSTITYTTSKGDSVTLRVTNCGSDSCYLMRDSVNMIYKVAKSSLRWLDISTESLLATLFPNLTTAEVQSVTITNGADKNYSLAVSGNSFTNNNVSITENEFDSVVKAVLSITPYVNESGTCDTSLSPSLTVTLTLKNGTKHMLDMIPTGSGSLYLVLDGNCRFTGSEDAVQSLLTTASQADGIVESTVVPENE